MSNQPYPKPITDLPLADLPMADVVGHLFQGVDGQSVFFELPKGSTVAAHSHGAQWGVVLEGEIELIIDGQRNIFKKGDYYFIEAGQEHEATLLADTLILDVFFEPDRYRAK